MKKLLFVATLILSGCQAFWAKHVPLTPQQELQKQKEEVAEIKNDTKLQADEFSKVKFLNGRKLSDRGIYYYLRGVNTSESEEGKIFKKHGFIKNNWFLQIYTYTDTENWAFVQRAYDQNGKVIGFEKIDSEVRDQGRVSEHGILKLDRDYLEKIKTTGMKFKIVGDKADFVFELPASYVDGFLQKLDAVG